MTFWNLQSHRLLCKFCKTCLNCCINSQQNFRTIDYVVLKQSNFFRDSSFQMYFRHIKGSIRNNGCLFLTNVQHIYVCCISHFRMSTEILTSLHTGERRQTIWPLLSRVLQFTSWVFDCFTSNHSPLQLTSLKVLK